MFRVLLPLLLLTPQSPAPSPGAPPSPAVSPQPTPSPAASPAPEVDASGTWKGTTSQGRDIEIVVEENDVKSVRLSWQIAFDRDCLPPDGGPPQRERQGVHFMRYQYPETVKGGALKTRIGIGGDLDAVVKGTFGADGNATGEVALSTIEDARCSGKLTATWTARRQ